MSRIYFCWYLENVIQKFKAWRKRPKQEHIKDKQILHKRNKEVLRNCIWEAVWSLKSYNISYVFSFECRRIMKLKTSKKLTQIFPSVCLREALVFSLFTLFCVPDPFNYLCKWRDQILWNNLWRQYQWMRINRNDSKFFVQKAWNEPTCRHTQSHSIGTNWILYWHPT
jgi:hypothetical protein